MRKLPTDPAKRRLQIFKRLYQHQQHFRALLESGEMEMPGIVTIPETGEEVYLNDLMVGIDSLPPRQREAFDMICLQGFTETDATRVMLPDSKWSTPVQQYADSALARMVTAYDQYQEGAYVHVVYHDKKKKKTQAEMGDLLGQGLDPFGDDNLVVNGTGCARGSTQVPQSPLEPVCPDAVVPAMLESR